MILRHLLAPLEVYSGTLKWVPGPWLRICSLSCVYNTVNSKQFTFYNGYILHIISCRMLRNSTGQVGCLFYMIPAHTTTHFCVTTELPKDVVPSCCCERKHNQFSPVTESEGNLELICL